MLAVSVFKLRVFETSENETKIVFFLVIWSFKAAGESGFFKYD